MTGDRTGQLHPDDLEVYELASLELRAAGIDDALADIPAQLVRYGAAQIIARAADPQAGRMAALAFLDLWQEQQTGAQMGYSDYSDGYADGGEAEQAASDPEPPPV